MKKINGYEKVEIYKESAKLPVGGYIIGILAAEEKAYPNGGAFLEIKFDIAEGEYKNFYTTQYKENQSEDKKYKGVYRMNIPLEDGSERDEWTMKRFKSDIVAIEESNAGYHWDWDESKFVGKKVGAVFSEKEWNMNGRTGLYTALHHFESIENIENGKFKIPQAKTSNTTSVFAVPTNDFANAVSNDDKLPWE